jgi:23S rRNA U2552 (ribose-2'-O)-methylase RlmE/FtsJ
MFQKINYESSLNNTDKFSGGVQNSSFFGHNYQLLYKNFLNNKLQKILEIGTANGGFAKFLKDNKFKSFNVGCDITPDDKHKHVSDYTNYNHLYDDFFSGNAFSQEFLDWNKVKEYKYDLVIEDADHTVETQAYMLQNCHYLLNEDGVYICEDVQSYTIAKQLIQIIPSKYKQFSYIWDGSFSIGRSDDICVVIDLRNNT